MKNRVYLLMTVLLGILSFSPSEAMIMDPSVGAQVGSPAWSVTIPVTNSLSVAQQIAFESSINWGDGTSPSGKISENQSPIPQDRVLLPKKDTTQTPERKKGHNYRGTVTLIK